MADMSQTATLVIGYGEQLRGRLGGTVAAGMPVRKQTDGTWIAATNASQAGANAEGWATSGGATGQPFTYQKGGNINPGGTVEVGGIYVLSAAGAVSLDDDVVTGDWITVLGVGISTSLIKQAFIVSGVQAVSDVA
jgi:hypothetical protein